MNRACLLVRVDIEPGGNDGAHHDSEKAVTRELAKKYRAARKKEKGKILNDLIDLTGYNRSYAATVLRKTAGIEKKKVGRGRKRVTLVEDRRMKPLKHRQRPRKYDDAVLKALKKIWTICDCICGKRLDEEVGWRIIHVVPLVRLYRPVSPEPAHWY